jgi:hypothetical protein
VPQGNADVGMPKQHGDGFDRYAFLQQRNGEGISEPMAVRAVDVGELEQRLQRLLPVRDRRHGLTVARPEIPAVPVDRVKRVTSTNALTRFLFPRSPSQAATMRVIFCVV